MHYDKYYWNILSIDSVASVHDTIKRSLEGFYFLDKRATILEARSIAQAKHILHGNPNIALVLLNTMEEEPESLDLIYYIRNVLNNDQVRIILRTGYPDVLPDIKIIQRHAIDGFISKETYSAEQIKIMVMTAIRAYHQIVMTGQILRGFAGSIAHEMRTPLATLRLQGGFLADVLPKIIAGYEAAVSHHLCANTISAPVADLLNHVPNKIAFEVDRSNVVIDMILAATAMDQVDKNTFKIFSIKECINEAIASYPFLTGDREKLDISEIKDFLFCGSDHLLVFVLFNLLKNSFYAIAAADKGGVYISTELGYEFNTLIFTDTGSGIPPGVLPHIFDTFFTSQKKGGTGVGLSFCKNVMNIFNGFIHCESELGVYTKFKLRFPALNQEELPLAASDVNAAPITASRH